MPKYFILLALVLVMTSCDSTLVSGDSRALQGYWDKNDKIEFVIPELDSLKNYNIYLNIRNSNDYPFSNLFLIVNMEFPYGKTVTDTLEYRMANPDGSWLGSGLGSIKENKLWYKENVSFFEPGEYKLSIEHAVRNNGEVEGVSQLEGITDVGYSIEESSNQ